MSTLTAKDMRLKELEDFFESTLEHPTWRNYRREHFDDWAMYDGDQLSVEDRAALAEIGQPITEVNKIFARVNNLSGAHRLTRARLGVVNRTSQTQENAEAYNDTLRYIQQRSGYEHQEAQMFDDSIVAGLGWIEAFTQPNEEGKRDILDRYVAAEDMYLDPFSRSYDIDDDARFVSRAKWVDLDDAITMFPGFKKELESAVEAQPVTPEFGSSSPTVRGPLDDYDLLSGSVIAFVDSTRRRLRLVETWYRKAETTFWLQTEDGLSWLPPIALKRLKEEEDFDGLEEDEILAELGVLKRKMKIIRVGIFTKGVLLSDKVTPHTSLLLINKYPFFPMFAFRKKSGEPYGYVRQMKPLQREINKRRSKALHLLNSRQIIMDKGAVDDVEVLREEAGRPDAILEKNPGKELIIDKNLALASSQIAIMTSSDNDMQDVIGIFDEALGKGTNARSGTAISKRIRTSNQNNVKVFDNLRRTRGHIGRFNIGLIQLHMTEERFFNILDDENRTKLIHLNAPSEDGQVQNAITQAIYDVTVEDLPINANVQEEQFDALVALAQSGIPIPPIILLQASQLRNKQELINMLQQQPEVPPPGSEQDGQDVIPGA